MLVGGEDGACEDGGDAVRSGVAEECCGAAGFDEGDDAEAWGGDGDALAAVAAGCAAGGRRLEPSCLQVDKSILPPRKSASKSLRDSCRGGTP